ncbi:perilipin-3-like [Pangshura tecta]
MSSNENEIKDAPSKSGEQEQQNLVSRVASLALVSAAYDMVSTTYTSFKETHPVIRSICDVAETGVRTITSATVSGAQPVLDQQEPPELLVSTASDSACESLDQLEEKLPVIQQPGDQVASDAKELVATLTAAKDAICSMDTGVKDAVTSMVGVAKGTVQESMEVTKPAVTSSMRTVLGSSTGQMIMSSVDLLSESLVDHYLPITDEELAKLAVSLESEEAPTEQQSYYVRLGSLSSTLRQRAYQHALGNMRQARQRTLEALSQLQQTIDLMEHAKQAVDQKAHDGQEKLQQMWLEWHKGQPGFSDDDNGSPQPEEMVSQGLATSHNLILQVQATCHSLLPNIKGLPASLQDKVQQAYENMGELQISFSNVQSFQELSEAILTQTREKVTKAQESLDELLEYVVQNAPLTWIVGPFAPAGDSTEKAEVPSAAEKAEG